VGSEERGVGSEELRCQLEKKEERKNKKDKVKDEFLIINSSFINALNIKI